MVMGTKMRFPGQLLTLPLLVIWGVPAPKNGSCFLRASQGSGFLGALGMGGSGSRFMQISPFPAEKLSLAAVRSHQGSPIL